MIVSHSFRAANLKRPSICTIGTFDGVHMGHQELINRVVSQARQHQFHALIVTFYPHPRPMMKNIKGTYLTLPEEKAAHIAALGVDHLVVLPFNRHTMNTTADDFVNWMIHRCRVASLWVGNDFALGKGRGGDVAFLQAKGREHGFSVQIFSPFVLGNAVVSSSRIRAALARGDIATANVCLGRPYSVYAAYASERRYFVHEDRAMPAPGRYHVRANGHPSIVTIPDNNSTQLIFDDDVSSLNPENNPDGDMVVRFYDNYTLVN
jgi:FAD synthase